MDGHNGSSSENLQPAQDIDLSGVVILRMR
jgi:hypothetical protein